MGIPELAKYEDYINRWHAFQKKVQSVVKNAENEAIIKQLNMYVLNQFFVKEYKASAESEMADFYEEFEARLMQAEEMLQMYR